MAYEPSLFPLRISTIYPDLVNGADISFSCEADRGGTYYCKGDKGRRLIRATEWFCTHLAAHLGIPTPECAILEHPRTSETFFGSQQLSSLASDVELSTFLRNPQRGELGQPAEWPGAYLSGLYAFDLFVSNPDRGMNNFLLNREGLTRRLCVFDFASVDITVLAGMNFPVASDATVHIGRFLRDRHGFFRQAAFEMIDRLSAVPAETIAGFLKRMPGDWMHAEQREGICELWSGKRLGGRLAALRTGIADESLL